MFQIEVSLSSNKYLYSFEILVIACFGFEGGIWVLIAPVSVHCILVTDSNVI